MVLAWVARIEFTSITDGARSGHCGRRALRTAVPRRCRRSAQVIEAYGILEIDPFERHTCRIGAQYLLAQWIHKRSVRLLRLATDRLPATGANCQ